MNRLETEFLGVKFNNPLVGASGTYGYGEDYKDYYPIDLIGGISSKGVTYNPKPGNSGIRLQETPSGLLNSIGLENPGIHEFVKHELKDMTSLGPRIFVNLGSNTLDEYLKSAEILNDYDFDFIELNISCPNVKEGGMAFGTNPKKACEVIEKVRKITKKVLMVKLSPNVGDIKEFVKIAENSGADCISLVNTFNALAIDVDNKKTVFENKTAGLSGPCIKPIALRMVYEASNATNLPIIGMGGISNYRDCLEFIMAGASAVQVGTSNFVDFNTMINIVDDLEKYMQRENLNSLEEIRKII